MAYVSMRQTITIKRASDTLDDWGNPVPGETFNFNCRIDEGWALHSYRSSGNSDNEVVVSTARILLDKLADIKETDIISFTNELGVTIERSPKQIIVKRNVSGNPIMTEVII
jgi:hypothetical protein